jgi:hypothetical protein
MTWHVDTLTAARYSSRATGAAEAASVEAHLMTCEHCRTMVNAGADDAVLTAVWQGVADVIDAPQLGWIERTLLAAGCSESTGRIVAATTRARLAYLFVVAFNVTLAILSSYGHDADAMFVAFLLLAPLGSLVATAGAFGRWVDPCQAVLRALPTSAWRMTLIRTVAGVVPAIVLTAVALPWVAERGWLAAAWLLPSLALSLVTLALASWFDVEIVSLVVAAVWIAIPLALQLPAADLLEVFAGPLQVISLVVATAGLVITVARHSQFDYRELS